MNDIHGYQRARLGLGEQSIVTATNDGIVMLQLDLYTAALVLETLDADSFRDNLEDLRSNMRAVLRNFERYRNL